MTGDLAGLFDSLRIRDRSSESNLKIREGVPNVHVFDHMLFFRTYCEDSSGYDSKTKDIVAGVSEVGDFSQPALEEWVRLQAQIENRIPTPLISVTPDPLRAFNRALHLQSKDKRDICIVVIDAWVLGSANIIECNKLRRLIGEEGDNLFETEVLVWQHVPSNAIIGRWPWKAICSSLGEMFPPLVDLSSIPKDGKRPLQTLRNSLKDLPSKPKMLDLARVLVDDLGLFHMNMTTKQIAMMMIGWSQGISSIDRYLDLPAMLERRMPKDLDELDYRLYVRSCHWYKDALVSFMPKSADEDLESMKIGTRIARNFNLPTFEKWRRARAEMEGITYEDEFGPESQKGVFLPILAKLGFNAQPMNLRRTVVKFYVGFVE